MHGQNKSRPLTNADTLQVHSIFYTIQGEGPYMGMTAVFVRLSGCNLRCHFCDTNWDDVNDKYMTPKEIVVSILDKMATTKLVVLTGGEPCRQNLGNLVVTLKAWGFTVQLETAGSYWWDWMRECQIVCSPKTKHVHPKVMQYCNDWKYVVRAAGTSPIDGLPEETTQEKNVPKDIASVAEFDILREKYGYPVRPPDRAGVTVWISPCDEGNPELNQLNTRHVAEVCLRHGYRASLQMHKYLNVE